MWQTYKISWSPIDFLTRLLACRGLVVQNSRPRYGCDWFSNYQGLLIVRGYLYIKINVPIQHRPANIKWLYKFSTFTLLTITYQR